MGERANWRKNELIGRSKNLFIVKEQAEGSTLLR